MLRNYIKIAWRNLWKNKSYSATNIFGLTLGMAVALLIGLWVTYEYSYDRFLPDYKSAYQLMSHITMEDGIRTQEAVSLPAAAKIKSDIPGVKYLAEAGWDDYHSLVFGENKLYPQGYGVGVDFLKIFQFEMIAGDRATCLAAPNNIVLTESTAKTLFGKEDPMGKIIKLDAQNAAKVTGILKDVPGNSTLRFKYLLPFAYLEQRNAWMKDARSQWSNNSFRVFVALQPNADLAGVQSKLANLYKASGDPTMVKNFVSFLQPVSKWHLFAEFKNGVNTGGYIDYVRMFCVIGILVLLIACINFMNLATARSEKRAKEVGVRKAVGSGRGEIILQFLMESLLLTFIAFVFSMIVVQLVLPSFNNLMGSNISVPYSNPLFWVAMVGYALFTGLLAGSRPAFYLSSFVPVKVLKGTMKTGEGATWPRKILVVVQFASSVALIIATVIIYQQIQYAKNRPKGYSPSRLVITDMSDDLFNHYDALRNELLATGMVESIAKTGSGITWIGSHTMIKAWAGKTNPEDVGTGLIGIDEHYFQTTGMQLVAGHNFFTSNAQADSAHVVVNEAVVKLMGLKDPVGKLIRFYKDGPYIREASIIGVVKDALMESPYTPVDPAIFFHGKGGDYLLYRIPANVSTAAAIAKISPIFERYNPSYPYLYRFVDTEYDYKFSQETMVGKLAAIFAGLTILISCLGLFALAAYMASQRTREIGIRKVLGATVWQLWALLSKDFIVLVLISCLLASPIAWYFVNNWLQQYNYRVNMSPGVFLLAGGLALVITIGTISYQAIRAALTDPVKSLRTE